MLDCKCGGFLFKCLWPEWIQSSAGLLFILQDNKHWDFRFFFLVILVSLLVITDFSFSMWFPFWEATYLNTCYCSGVWAFFLKKKHMFNSILGLREVINAPLSVALLMNVDCIFRVLVKLQYFWFITLTYNTVLWRWNKTQLCWGPDVGTWVVGREEGPGAGLVPSAEHLLGISRVSAFSFWFSFHPKWALLHTPKTIQWCKPKGSKGKSSEDEQKGLLQKHFPVKILV